MKATWYGSYREIEFWRRFHKRGAGSRETPAFETEKPLVQREFPVSMHDCG
jgi:hypothetical protein